MTDIQRQLFALQDKQFQQFQSKLIPDISPDRVIGVRMPAMRKLAKQLVKEGNTKPFLQSIPHTYYDEDILHGLIVCEETDFDKTVELLEQWLPYIDNWAVCDLLNPKAFQIMARHNPDKLSTYCLRWLHSSAPYTIRFGTNMLMTHFLDEHFSPLWLEHVANIQDDSYYVRMGVAWYFATALAKQYNATLPYLEQHLLPEWTHRKTIQKAIESFRVSREHKAYLRTLR